MTKFYCILLLSIFIGVPLQLQPLNADDKRLVDSRAISEIESSVRDKVFHSGVRKTALEFCYLLKEFRMNGDFHADEMMVEDVCHESRALYLEAIRYGELYPNDLWQDTVKPIVLELYQVILSQKGNWSSHSQFRGSEMEKAFHSMTTRFNTLSEFEGAPLKIPVRKE